MTTTRKGYRVALQSPKRSHVDLHVGYVTYSVIMITILNYHISQMKRAVLL